MRKNLPSILVFAATGVFLGALYLYLWGDVTVGVFLGATTFAGIACGLAALLGLRKENAPPGEGGASSSS